MGLTKTDLFTAEQNKLAQMAKVLGHPARIAIIEILVRKNDCINTSLVSELGLAQATISQHLKELKSVGIIQGSVAGKTMNYCINPAVWQQFTTSFSQLFSEFDCCKKDEQDCN